jgi:hypothetical protein
LDLRERGNHEFGVKGFCSLGLGSRREEEASPPKKKQRKG